MSHRFNAAALAFGVLLVVGALLSGLARRSFVSLAALFVLVGFVLGEGVTGALRFDPTSGFVSDLATAVLIVILFRDGLEVEGELLEAALAAAFAQARACDAAHGRHRRRRAPGGCGPVLDRVLPAGRAAVADRSGAVLQRGHQSARARLVRHSLNLESGLNDGLALPAVLALAAVLSPHGHGFVWWRFVLENLAFGFAVGSLTGVDRGTADPEGPNRDQALFGLGTRVRGLRRDGAAANGNGLIAAFVAAITLAVRRPGDPSAFERQATGMVDLVELGIFVVFGSLLTFHGLFQSGWAAVGVVAVTLLRRPAGRGLRRADWYRPDMPTRGFMSWFGPEGVATMTFSILVLSDGITQGSEIFNLAALTVFVSIIVHGVTDTAGIRWMARRAERDRALRAE